MNVKHLRRLSPVITVIGLLVVLACDAGRPDLPNIIIILADDLGYGDLGCYGAERIPTPNCDRLAEGGIRFTDAHTASAVCSPSRYSLLTGRYAWRTWLKNGIILEHMPLIVETDRLTLPKMLQEKGYETGCVGKWHLGWGTEINPNWDGRVAPGPLEVGFDYFFGLPFSHSSSAKQRVWFENRRVVGLEPGESLDDGETLKRITRNMEHTAETLSKSALRFIERYPDKPFFLYYPTVNVHRPWTPAREFHGKSEAGIYGDFVMEFDWVVGQIVETLDRLGLTERTLLIVTSDNGANNGGSDMSHKANGELRGMKGDIFEAGHRVPFIASWPGVIEPGSESDETICLSDLMATIATVVGYDLPETAGEDSYDIMPALRGGPTTAAIREATVHHSVTRLFAIRQGKWKYIEGRGDGNNPSRSVSIVARENLKSQPQRNPQTGEFNPVWWDFRYQYQFTNADSLPAQLYDMEADTAERVNLWGEHPEIVERLQKLLDRYRDEGRSR